MRLSENKDLDCGRFIRAQDFFNEMYASQADRSTRQLLNTLFRVECLLIDGFGYVNLRPEQTKIFLKRMEERYCDDRQL